MTTTQMADAASYLHHEARGKNPLYDPTAVNAEVRRRCDQHGLNYDRVVGMMFAAGCRRLARTLTLTGV